MIVAVLEPIEYIGIADVRIIHFVFAPKHRLANGERDRLYGGFAMQFRMPRRHLTIQNQLWSARKRSIDLFLGNALARHKHWLRRCKVQSIT